MTPDPVDLSTQPNSDCSWFSFKSCNHECVKSTCRICLSDLDNPAKLSCGHRFCECCLDKYWQTREKPVYIVCPLCRGNAFNVYFSEKGAKRTDFHRVFSPVTTSDLYPSTISTTFDTGLNKTLICLTFTMVIPFIFFLLKCLKPTIIDLYNFFQVTLGYGYRL